MVIDVSMGDGTSLNPKLVEKQGLTQEDVNHIKEAHVKKSAVFVQMEKTNDPLTLKHLAKEVEALEFELQRLWGFPQDASFHYWWEVPKCACPKMDNRDWWGVNNHRIIMANCPIHGQ